MDKTETKLEAIRLAVQVEGVTDRDVISVAERIERYINGVN